MVAAESMMMGKVCIISDNCGISDYIDDGKNIRLSSDFSGELLPDENSKNRQKDSFFEKKIKAYREWVLKTRKNLLVPLPQNGSQKLELLLILARSIIPAARVSLIGAAFELRL